MSSLEAWLETPEGTRIRIDAAGVIAGRASTSEIVLVEAKAHRQHALFAYTGLGPRIVALGNTDVLVNGEHIRVAVLDDGDVIELPGLRLTIIVPPIHETLSRWAVQIGGVSFTVPDTGLRVASDGQIRCDGWTGDGLWLQPEGEVLMARAALPCRHDRTTPGPQANPPPRVVPVLESFGCGADDVMEPEAGGTAIVVIRLSDTVASTIAGLTEFPDTASLEMLPRGGRLHLQFGRETRSLYLAERRFSFLSALIEPSGDYVTGDAIPDEIVLSTVWPRNPGKSRVDLNVLLKRTRGDFEAADLSSRIVERGPGGGSTRIVLAQGPT